MNKKGQTLGVYFTLILVIVISGLAFWGFSAAKDGQFFSIGGENQFAKPLWGRLECVADPIEDIETKTIASSGGSIFCGGNEFTNECDFKMKDTRDNFFSTPLYVFYKECDNDGTNCDSSFTQKYFTAGTSVQDLKLEVPAGRKLYVECGNTAIRGFLRTECEVQKEYFTFRVYRFVGGAKFEAQADDCRLTSGLRSLIPQGENPPAELAFGQYLNFVDDWAYGPAQNVYNNYYTGYQDKYCTAGQLFDIAKVKMADGKLVPINPEYAKPAGSPEYINTIGSVFKAVECCPSEPFCGEDFKFHRDIQEASCFSDVQCANAGNPVPYDQKSYYEYTCESGECVQSALISVDCTSNAACPNGQICDLSLTNYGQCITQESSYCGDETCGLNEDANNCPSDCSEDSEDIENLNTKLIAIVVLIFFLIGGFVTRSIYEEGAGRVIGNSVLILSGLGLFFIVLSIMSGWAKGLFLSSVAVAGLGLGLSLQEVNDKAKGFGLLFLILGVALFVIAVSLTFVSIGSIFTGGL